ncbi:MAG: GAF domain-containing protein [Actinophytocola sp.]|nr:GAF domain-containing protein [Actinophytocola sp.]
MRGDTMTTRLGMITPSSNTCLEPVTYRLLGERRDVTAHFTRVPVTRIGLDTGSDAQFGERAMLAAAEQLADAKVDVVLWHGTAGSWLGIEHDTDLADRLTAATGVPATTATLAMLAACRVYGVSKLGLATPYLGGVNDRITGTYRDAGIDIVTESHLGLDDNEAFARVPPATVAEQVRAVAADAHACAVLCTNVHGAELAGPLEAELGVPLLDSVSVTLWHALRLAGVTRPVPGFGTLLRDGFVRAEMQQVCETLLDATGADRTTLRVDVEDHDLHVDLTAAEALRPGVRAIRREGSLDQRRLNTVEWLELNRANLVQPHFNADPHPPQALIDTYGVHAQILGPVECQGDMTGWLSVHSLTERQWHGDDIAALDAAREQAAEIIAPLVREGAHA